MHKPEIPEITPYTFVFSWRRFLMHCSIIGCCILLGLMTWYFGKPDSVRFYETRSGETLTAKIASNIDTVLDSHSFISVKDSEPLQIEFFKGKAYFDVKQNSSTKLEVKVGKVLIKSLGTRFSIQINKDGSNHIAVAEGYIKIYTSSGIYQISGLEQANFNDFGISNHTLISEHSIAPWRSEQ